MRQRPTKEVEVPWRIIVPVGLVLVVSTALGLGAMNLAKAPTPGVLSEEAQAALVENADNPYTLAQLLERLPPDGVSRVAKYLDYFQEKRRLGLQSGLARSTRYISLYTEIFRSRGLPEELAYLPLIESGFVENATSPAAAVGVWQFTAETGRRFNLHANDWFDKRRDPINSAYAAATYLKTLHKEFQNWDLALAAYNSGAGTVRWARRVNRKANKPQNYWMLDELPEETRNYVPAFIAAVLIAKNPDAFGFHKIRWKPKMTYERIKVSPGITLTYLASQMEMDEDDLYSLNPELLQGETPPGESHYLLRIPPGMRQIIPSKVTGAQARLNDWVLHRVLSTDTVAALAARFAAKPDRIQQVNGLQSDGELARRQFVIIPL